MHYFSADHIFPVSSPPIENGIVITDDSGRVLDLLPDGTKVESSEVKKFPGVICPGFVNAHCHLELSWLKGRIPDKKGIDEFIRVLEQERKNTGTSTIQQAIEDAEAEMIKNGIVAVGDISNGNNTFSQKRKKNIHYHTFIEVFAFHPAKADAVFERARGLYDAYLYEVDSNSSHLSITPHAPYSASANLLKLIAMHADENKSVLSMHNQESDEENDFFFSKKGNLVERMKSFGIDISSWNPTGLSSLKSTLPLLPKKNKLQLVHNTVTSFEEITWAEKYFGEHNLFWCTCPNANLYIENRLPDYKKFIEASVKMTIGTDSLASNYSLSILDEMKSIRRNAPFVDFNSLLSWATINGAEFLGIDDTYGSIERGKRPGLLNIVNLEEGLFPGENAIVTRII